MALIVNLFNGNLVLPYRQAQFRTFLNNSNIWLSQGRIIVIQMELCNICITINIKIWVITYFSILYGTNKL